MLETKFKIALLLTVLFLASLPVMGILKGTFPPPEEPLPLSQDVSPPGVSSSGAPVNETPVKEEVVLIPAGFFLRGTNAGGYDEQPERRIYLDAYLIDRYEATNHQYQAFVVATGHRKAAPPSRYAKNLSRMRGANQPVTYVSWDDADAYCRWNGKRLPTEAEWEKAMRGVDGRLWPWGNDPDPLASNWGSARDGFEVTAPVGSLKQDVSPFGVADGSGNVMEWVADWYAEDAYRYPSDRNPQGPDHGVYKVLRGGGYTSAGADVRITSRSRMVPDFRDETIGFRCVSSGEEVGKGRSPMKG
ncbi:MAG: formylglycine-generating enzyme family protein [Nitrospirae bacterium]|nr:formylglycine-generating enzyme family protein [Nitrospirota bacterium]